MGTRSAFEFGEVGGLVMENPPGLGSLLLHMCCAPDSLYIFKTLREHAPFRIAGYFYDPNIHPREEYDFRLAEALRAGDEMGVPVYPGEYDAEDFFRRARGMEREPEGGVRCVMCFDMRLERTARFCAERGFDAFTTVLTVSSHKNAQLINRIGRQMAARHGVRYAASDFKKRGGFVKSVEAGKEAGLYRQDYCGCLFSMPGAEGAGGRH